MSSIGGIGVQTAVQVSVLKKELDAQEVEGEAVLDLLDQTAEVLEKGNTDPDPHVGRNLDTYL